MTKQETSDMLDKVINLIFMPWKLKNATTDPELPRRLCLGMLKYFIDGMKESAPFNDIYQEALDTVLLKYGQYMKVKRPSDDEDAWEAKQYSNQFFLFMIFAAPLPPKPTTTEEDIESIEDIENNLINEYEQVVDTSGYKKAKRYKAKATEFMTAVFSGLESVDNYINYSDATDIKKDHASPAIARIVKVPMSPHALLPEYKAEPADVIDAQAVRAEGLDDETKEKVLKAVFDHFKGIICGNQKYKWGHLFHALVKAGLIDSKLSLSEYATLVQSYDGASYKTVRRHKDSFFRKTKDKDQWEDTVNWMYERILKIKEEVCSSSKAA